jgi:hypothetical protein
LGRWSEAPLVASIFELRHRLKFIFCRIDVATALKSIEEDQSPSVCLAYIEDVSAARIDYALRRIVREGHEAHVIVCLLGPSTDLGDGLNSEYPVARTLVEIVAAVKEKVQVSSAAASVT